MKTIRVLLLAAAACGGSGTTIDTSVLIGIWNGTETLVAGSKSAQGTGSIGVTANGAELSLGGLCIDSSILSATAASATEFSIPQQNCPLYASPTGCSAITLGWTTGHGTVANNVLTITATGTLAGCGQSLTATFTFNGRK